MSSESDKPSVISNIRSIGWSLIFGLAAYVGFYLAIKQGVIDNPDVIRYFTGHPVSHVATGMFLIGLAALAMKALEVLSQYDAVGRIRLDNASPGEQTVEDCDGLLDGLRSLPSRLHRSYLWRRLHDALENVQRKRSADGLDEELKYLADQDADRQHESYSLVRILIWAIPMLGFLGTVIGITMALENFGTLDIGGKNLNDAMKVLLSGLYIAFDTTALALSLSVLLMFAQFLIDRFETQVLASVDARVAEQLVGRFEEAGSGTDPHVRSIEKMCRSVVRTTERLVDRQSNLWQATVDAAHQRWSNLSEGSTQQMQTAIAGALDDALQKHAERMTKVENAFSDQTRQRWEHWQVVMSDNARLMQEQQKEMVAQGEIMKQIVQATGDLMGLQTVLNENLKSLAGAKNFEDTVMSLSAAIHLLNTRLGAPTAPLQVDLTNTKTQGYAA